MTDIALLVLAYNSFTGIGIYVNIPRVVCLSIFRYPLLLGTLPSAIGSLQKLALLSISYNKFNGM